MITIPCQSTQMTARTWDNHTLSQVAGQHPPHRLLITNIHIIIELADVISCVIPTATFGLWYKRYTCLTEVKRSSSGRVYWKVSNMATFFALLSALFIGLNTIVIKKSLNRASTFSAAVMLTAVGTIFFWIITLFGYPHTKIGMNLNACLYFIVAGFFAPGLLRLVFFVGIERVGVSIASSIMATIPAFAAVVAVIFLNENLTTALAFGIILIVVGVILFEQNKTGIRTAQYLPSKDIALLFLGAVAGAVAITFRKIGLQIWNFPALGVALGFSSALGIYLTMMACSPKLRREFSIQPGDLPLFVVGGLSLAFGWLCIFYALSYGPVVLVAPLNALHPLVVLALSTIFLKDAERITGMTILGCISVLSGVILITIF